MLSLSTAIGTLLLFSTIVLGRIDRKSVVQQFNLKLNTSHTYSPLQVGNGNFAFGVDITGLQTFLPHNTLSSWGWHTDSLPIAPKQNSVKDHSGVNLRAHDGLYYHERPGEVKKESSQWMIANPHRINLGRVGLWFGDDNVTEKMLLGKSQVLNLWEGCIQSSFSLGGDDVSVVTVASPDSDTLAVEIKSKLLGSGALGVLFDFPYASGKNKFDAPFVGIWNASERHKTFLGTRQSGATIKHVLDSTVYFADVKWESDARMQRQDQSAHKYILKPKVLAGETFRFTVNFSEQPRPDTIPTMEEIRSKARMWWQDYWEHGAFISLPIAWNASAKELQRRIILSQYLLAVNGAGKDPAQESGLVNNGWYGKFHMEMAFWHLAHWTIWDKWSLYDRSIGVYDRFLPSSIERARKQGYKGARLGKMSDPSGGSAPGEINRLLIWQQPHPMYFAEMEYRKFPTEKTLQKWDHILTPIADFMASYAHHNETTKPYDLGPPLHIVSETTSPNKTRNPPFELAYWRFGLSIASKWKQRQRKPIPKEWTTVYQDLAPFPTQNDLYVLYEGVENPWTTRHYTEDHPSLLGLNGWLPPDPLLNHTTFTATVHKVHEVWNFSASYGWDFPLLALTAAKMGKAEEAVNWLLHEDSKFNEVGMPVGGFRVPTPYFPAAGALLLAVGMMAGGWDGTEGMVFPVGWEVEIEEFQRAL
ncbi:hypothetical protein FKW77_001225 [Venturia effusa]|uniref:Six-hairpin glycosidase-like protein n=1 Tax=Venturia effusa TaxID=50376 RepID=A0A517LND2_9PEZI|nr:hypothetical protein FKW77_001225 [Venturia effusa]